MIDVLMPASGRPFVDLIFTGLDHVPAPGEEVYADDLTIVPGGALTGALVLHRLGLKVIFEATLGCDFGSRFLLEAMEEEGLSRDAVTIDDEVRANVTVAYNQNDDRSFLSFGSPRHSPPDPGLVEHYRPRAILMAGLRTGDEITQILRLAKKVGAIRIADSQSQPLNLDDEELRKVVSSLEVLLCNEQEACFLTGIESSLEAANLLATLVPTLVLKRGPQGAVAFWPYGNEELAPPLVKVVDSTGCGDNFSAAFTAAMLAGCMINECLAWGNVAGAQAAAAPGGTSRKIGRDELLDLVKQHYGESLAPDPLRMFTIEEGPEK